MTLNEYNQRYEEALHSNDLNKREKDMELSELMTGMELKSLC